MFGIDDLVTGGLSSAGALINNWFAGQRQEDAQAFNAAQAQTQMDFQERMSSTAYTRGMHDMKNAGLNPILAYQKGGASSPSGAMASTTAAPTYDMLGPGVNTAMARQRLTQELDNMVKTNDNIMKDTRLKVAQGTHEDARTLETIEKTKGVTESTKKTVEETQKAIAENVRNNLDKGFYSSEAGRIARMLGNTGDEAQRASSAAGNFMNPVKTFNEVWKSRVDRGRSY